MFLDIAIVGIILLLVVVGFLRGFIKEIFGIGGLFLASMVTISYHDYFLEVYSARVPSHFLAEALSAVTVFLGIMVCIMIVNGLLMKVLAPIRCGLLDRVAGLLVGGAKGLFISYFLIFVMQVCLYVFVPSSKVGDRVFHLPVWFVNTYSYNLFAGTADYIGGEFIPEGAYTKIDTFVRGLFTKQLKDED